MNVLIRGLKASNISGISDAIFSRYIDPQKSSQNVRACPADDGAICSKNRKIVPYHRESPNTRNGARLRSPSPIMVPVRRHYLFRVANPKKLRRRSQGLFLINASWRRDTLGTRMRREL